MYMHERSYAHLQTHTRMYTITCMQTHTTCYTQVLLTQQAYFPTP